MSGSLPSGRYLRARVGPVVSARRPQFRLGSTVTVVFELVDRQSGQFVGAAGFSAIAYRPEMADFGTYLAPVTITLLALGLWEVRFRAEMPGEYTVFGTAPGTTTATCTQLIEVVSRRPTP